jgi:hypothetical protein
MLRQDRFEREMFSRRFQIVWHGQTIWIATAEDILLHKLYWNRITPSDRQLSDAAGIVAVQKDALDANYLTKWAAELGVIAELEDVISGKISPKQT